MAKLSSRGAAAAVVLLVYFAVGVIGLRRAELMNMTSQASTIDYRAIVPAIVIFGDSTVDAGNNNYLLTVVKSNFEPYGRQFEAGATGRFCDGKIVTDYITERIGLPLSLPYLAPNAHGSAILTGINFASSASGWYDGTAANFNVKGLTAQFLWYKNWKNEVVSLVGPEKGNDIISKAIYVFSTGSNDWELYQLGGRNIAVLDLPPLGCVPSQITLHGKGKPGCVEDLNNVAVEFNRQLQALINSLKPTLHGKCLLYIDTYNIVNKLVQNPNQYGFKETRTGCCGTGVLETAILCNKESIGTCQDAYPYVWWDSFHPTTHAYSLLALDVFGQVEPYILAPPQP